MLSRPSPTSSLTRVAAPAFALALGLLWPSLLHAQTALREWNFSTKARASLDAQGWAGWGSAGKKPATNYTAHRPAATGEAPRLGLHIVPGVGRTPGVLFAHTGASAEHDRFVVTTTFDPLPAAARLSWEQAANNPGCTVRVLVQVGDKWYASQQQFKTAKPSSAGGMTNSETKTLDLAGSSGLNSTAWLEVTFGEKQPIAVQNKPVRKAPGTPLTGIGFLLVAGDAPNRVVFVDNVALHGQ